LPPSDFWGRIFFPGGKSTRVQVWLLIKLKSSSRIESILVVQGVCDRGDQS
jgi:hypothetical protein